MYNLTSDDDELSLQFGQTKLIALERSVNDILCWIQERQY
jgi:hypothetical protein